MSDQLKYKHRQSERARKLLVDWLRDRFCYLKATETEETAKVMFMDEVKAYIQLLDNYNHAALASTASYQATLIAQTL